MDKRLPVFDWIRSVAIVIILFHHLPNYTFNFYDLNYFGIPLDLSIVNELAGYFGLSLFIFMSGYLLNAKKVVFSTWGEIRNFAKQKLVRIFPLYYLSLTLFAFIENVHNPIKILIHLLGLQLILRASTDSIPIRTLWFVGFITIYYFIFAVIKNRSLDRRLRVGILVSSWIVPLALNGYFGLMDYRISLYWVVFWFGVLCAEKDLPQRQAWTYLSQAAIVLFVALFISLDVEFEPLVGSGSTFALKYLTLNALILSFVVVAYNACNGLAQRFKFQSGLRFIAYISYCTYLFHRPVWYEMSKLLVNEFSVDSQYLLLAVLTLCGIPIIFVLSYGLQVIYDRYFRPYFLSAFKTT